MCNIGGEYIVTCSGRHEGPEMQSLSAKFKSTSSSDARNLQSDHEEDAD